MKVKTFDMLDAYFFIEKKSEYEDLPPNPRFSASKETLIIDPKYWEAYYPLIAGHSFNWGEFKLDSRPDLNTLIPSSDPGIYIFYIQPENAVLGMPKFVIYVGISNASGSNRPLRERLSDYFYLSKLKKRSSLDRLLIKYYKYTYVAFSTLSINMTSMLALEQNVIGFFYPIANKDDFPVAIADRKKAFNLQ